MKWIKDNWWNRTVYSTGKIWVTGHYKDFQHKEKGFASVYVELLIDPRTGKPWKSMKVAREWACDVTKERV